MTDINNGYKRYQNYKNPNVQNTLKHNYMEQNYKIGDKKVLGEKKEIGEKRELPKQDNAFLKNATRLGVNNQGQFFKK